MRLNNHIKIRNCCQSLIFVLCYMLALSAQAAHDVVSVDDPKYILGQKVFTNYCTRCHGKHADGRGRSTPLYVKLKSAHPSNFQLKFYSFRPKEYLKSIIRDGGAEHSLSEYMPPFGAELSAEQIDDVVYFIQKVSLYMDSSSRDQITRTQK